MTRQQAGFGEGDRPLPAAHQPDHIPRWLAVAVLAGSAVLMAVIMVITYSTLLTA